MKKITGKQRNINEKSLANLKKIKKGESLNPSGRPKGIPDFKAALIRKLNQNPEKLDEIIDSFLDECLSGNMNAIKELADRLNGKVSQPLSGADGEAIKVLVEYVNQKANGHQD